MINDRAIGFSNASVKASPGYFGIELANGVVAEMTVTSHTALYRFNFSSSAGDLKPLIAVDLIDLPQSRSDGTATVDPSTGRLSGSGTFNPSFGIGTYDLYFCADFSGASISETGVWMDSRAGTTPKTVTVVSDGVNTDATLSAGAFTQFNAPSDNSISARVGVSFISVDQACSNAEKEIPDFDFAKTLSAAETAWDSKFSIIQVDETGVDENLLQTFWSGVYRAMISPQDYSGENPLWTSNVPYYDSYYWLVLIYIFLIRLVTYPAIVFGICIAACFHSSVFWIPEF
jgi:putative alpha-1,2-mannosidase